MLTRYVLSIAGIRRCCVFGWALVIAWGLLFPDMAIAFAKTCFIDQARHLPNGAVVTVTGNVIVPSGAFSSANLDAGFAIQDVTGGIYVTTADSLALELGETVTVTGQLQNDGHGQRILQLQTWQLSQRPLLPMLPLKTSAARAGKQLDGQLVTVVGVIVRSVVDDTPYGDRLWIQDDTGELQIYMPKSTRITPSALPFLKLGQTVQVTGLSSQFDRNDEVIPRSRADIVELP